MNLDLVETLISLPLLVYPVIVLVSLYINGSVDGVIWYLSRKSIIKWSIFFIGLWITRQCRILFTDKFDWYYSGFFIIFIILFSYCFYKFLRLPIRDV